MSRWLLAVAFVSALPMTLKADVLVLRNGTRVQGELVGVRGSVIEFEERRGFGSGRTVRYDRDEVVRIEFETSSNNDNYGRGGYNSGYGGNQSGLRERQVQVAANVPWVDAGIDVRPGQTVYFEARGEVRWGRDRRDGPEGEHNSPNNPNRPIPSRPAGSLIGKVGNGNDSFYVGAETGPVRMRSGGRLYLGVNDDYLQDNSGYFTVVVRY